MGDDHLDRTRVERVDPLVGAVLDRRYRIEFRLAAGGFGAIYRAIHLESGREVALKVLHTELATNDARVIARFRREGAMLMQLRSPHTVTAYELGEDPSGPLYIVMELLHGESLYEIFRAKGRLPWQRMAAIARMVCDSLAEAHELGIVHRDLKPANIHLEKRDGNPDFVKVLDFGIAKIVRESDIADMSDLTQAGQVIGTLDYMAPEQMVGGQCTAATDIYALAVVMFEMVAGERPFGDSTTATSILANVLTRPAPLLSSKLPVPEAFDAIVARCLEREPHHRPMHAAELARELDRVLVPDEGVTIRKPMSHVMGAPQIEGNEEATVIAQPRPRRREGSAPPTPVPEPAAVPEPLSAQPHHRDSGPANFQARAFVISPDGQMSESAQHSRNDVHEAVTRPAHATANVHSTPTAFGPGQFPPTHGAAQPSQFQLPQPRPSHSDLSGYNMSAEHDRDVLVRRVVWGIAIVLGVVLVIVIASRL